MPASFEFIPPWLLWTVLFAFPLAILLYNGYKLNRLRAKRSRNKSRIKKLKKKILICLAVILLLIGLCIAATEELPPPDPAPIQQEDMPAE